MLNPDGVILGNYKCNFEGKDINRAFTDDLNACSNDRAFESELMKKVMA